MAPVIFYTPKTVGDLSELLSGYTQTNVSIKYYSTSKKNYRKEMKTRFLLLFDHFVYSFVFLSAFKIREKKKKINYKKYSLYSSNLIFFVRRMKRRSTRFLLPVYLIFIFQEWVERHDFWPRFWLFFSTFLSPPKKEGRKKGEWISNIVIKSHAFLLDHFPMHIKLSSGN